MRPPRSAGIARRRDADQALAAALIAGDPGAAREAWTRLSPLVLRILRRFIVPGPDRQDLCQEVFLRFFARITELRDPRALRHFVTGICLGVAQNALRRARVRRAADLARAGALSGHPVAPPDLEAREAVRRFYRILAGARAEERALFVVRHVHQMELADIAAARGWPVITAKRRVARATRRVGLRMKRDPALAGYVERLLPPRRGENENNEHDNERKAIT
jgi:RNA polymerase sigma-70 factor (ECF subfamily)